MNIYPIKFVPIVKDKIWGGQRLNTLLGKNLGSLPNGGESWELSAVKGDVSVIANGDMQGLYLTEAIAQYKEELVGRRVYAEYGDEFPLLIKFIDANDDLSIQVHPNDALAREKGYERGKTEMWYVIDSEDGHLISGFKTPVASDEYESRLKNGTFIDLLAVHEVRRGDIFFIPAGRIHAIGKGVMVAEIQQTSDVTYRVYDYDRRDANGNCRQLHVAEAKEALNFADDKSGKVDYDLQSNQRTDVVDSKYFKTGVLKVDSEMARDYSGIDCFVVLICVKGCVRVDGVELKVGETALIPAAARGVNIVPDVESELLEVCM